MKTMNGGFRLGGTVRRFGGRAAFAAAVLCAVCAMAGDGPDFAMRPMTAGRALLTSDGFIVQKTFGTANFTPELAFPVELVYESASERTGLFGFAWRSPQLESSAAWDKDGVLWTTPWGERIKFFPKKTKPPKDEIKLPLYEDAKKGRGFFAPHADWEADTRAADARTTGDWTFAGRRSCRGWSLAYRDGRLAKVTAPSGRTLDFTYDRAGRPAAVSQDGVAFVEIACGGDGRAESVTVNGVETILSYENGSLAILPKTPDGQIVPAVRPRLAAFARAGLAAETFRYVGNHLSEIRCGDETERFEVQEETLADRRANLRSAQPKSKVKHSGKVAGRLLADRDFRYAYGGRTGIVTLTDGAGRVAEHDLNAKTGVLTLKDFSGRRFTVSYFMRHDVAYLGKVRAVVDGRGDDVVSFRYGRLDGRVSRVRDRLGNDRLFARDGAGNVVRETRRRAGSQTEEPVRAVARDAAGNPVAVSELDADGKAVRTAVAAYDAENRPVRVSDGRNETRIAYTKWGRPAVVTDALGRRTVFAYDRWNRPVSVTDADGVVSSRAYNAAGLVSRLERREGDEVVQAVDIAYDGAGRPVSYTGRDGRVKAYARDGFGRIVKEIFPDATECAYTYDGAGRLVKVLDENRHEILFGWGAAGLERRTTAAGQLTDYVRDETGAVKAVLSSKDGRTDRAIRTERDRFGRPVRVTYAKDETETFAYDAWGRLAKHTRGRTAETYAYDHFGRLAAKCEDGVRQSYAYDAWGRRTRRTVTDAGGAVVSDETRTYDRHGRLAEIRADGGRVTYAYGADGRVAKQTVDGRTIAFAYTRYGRLASKTLLGADGVAAALKYWYGTDGRIVARLANERVRKYGYDRKGQLTSVTGEDGTEYERYEYDPAGNVLSKTVDGRTTVYAYDGANQLVTATDDGGTVTRFAYDAAGRMVREGAKTYRYGYLDKVLSVKDGKEAYAYTYHADGQIASAARTGAGAAPEAETFLWDGLALVRRGGTSYVNEPHPNGGSPVLSSSSGVMFNDILGTTLGVLGGAPQGPGGAPPAYAAADMTAFGDAATAGGPDAFFTGKPLVAGLGHAFLFRNYRASLGKWHTADPLGYPDGWNQAAYCGNKVQTKFDLFGACECEDCNCTILVYPSVFNDGQFYFMGRDGVPILNPSNELMNLLENYFPYAHYFAAVHDTWVSYLTDALGLPDWIANIPSMPSAYAYAFGAASYDKFLEFIAFLERFRVDPISVPYCTCE